ncbi:MAG: helicase/secretion neighborhood CpaE-like protein [Pseudonocardiales bacterium]|nr:helicase/secretion neighborhood CpaE-like protein [Pseudonocardiales bacterium]
MLAVVGACGGAGASSFAAALAASRPPDWPSATLLDLDPAGGGLDVLLGLDAHAGARWSDIRLDGGVLEPESLRRRLPAVAGVGVLACDYGADPSERDAQQVLVAARRLGPVVLDVPRWLPAAARSVLPRADATVVMVPCEVRAVVVAAALIPRLQALGACPIPVLRPGRVPLAEAARVLGAQDDDVLPNWAWLGGDRAGRLDLSAVPDRIAVLANRLWARPGRPV